jgi:UDP-N-acetylmuramoyl-tripeptide--D-alanyl-D-alanine ligase
MGAIASACGGKLVVGGPSTPVETITTDSRELGMANLFVPIAGERFDGHDYISALAQSGSLAGFLTSRESDLSIAERSGAAAILCEDTLAAYGALAASHRASMKAKIVGITGTNGKTTTKELLCAMLSAKYACLKNEKNYNNEIGLPFTLLHLRPVHEVAVIELGMNHAGEIDRLSRIARPDVAVITNIGEGHLEFLETVEGVARAKAEILSGLVPGGKIFLNRDTQCFDVLCEAAGARDCEVITFGLYKNAHVYAEDYALGMADCSITVRGETYRVPVFGIHNLYNLLLAVALGIEFGVESGLIESALASFKNIDKRSQVIDKGFILIDDTYNSNPLSTRYALMSMVSVFPAHRKVAVLADMKELGAASASHHERVGRMMVEYGIDELCAFGDEARLYVEGALAAGMKRGAARHFEDRKELAEYLKRTLAKGDAVLVKGSRSMNMEEVADALVR